MAPKTWMGRSRLASSKASRNITNVRHRWDREFPASASGNANYVELVQHAGGLRQASDVEQASRRFRFDQKVSRRIGRVVEIIRCPLHLHIQRIVSVIVHEDRVGAAIQAGHDFQVAFSGPQGLDRGHVTTTPPTAASFLASYVPLSTTCTLLLLYAFVGMLPDARSNALTRQTPVELIHHLSVDFPTQGNPQLENDGTSTGVSTPALAIRRP